MTDKLKPAAYLLTLSNGEKELVTVKSYEDICYKEGAFDTPEKEALYIIPDGYTLVPDEPTEAMLETGVDALMSTEIVADRLVILIYKAMLKAVKESL